MPETDDPDDQRVRHAPHAARGRLDLRPVLHRAQGPRRAARRSPRAPSPSAASPAPGTSTAGSACPTSCRSPQQRNVVLHPEFVGGKYAFYTRPQDGFIEAGSGGGIGWALCDRWTRCGDRREHDHRPRYYHTIKEVKNGAGPAPDQDPKGWLHVAHGVRELRGGLRYVLYASSPTCATRAGDAPPRRLPARPEGEERVGDVSTCLLQRHGRPRTERRVLIYYASSDTRLHVARTDVDRLLDYVLNTPEDGLRSAASVPCRAARPRPASVRPTAPGSPSRIRPGPCRRRR
jgi:hypothetical protein